MLEEYNAKNIEYNGKKLTEYEALQEQRYIERNIRRWKREESAMKAAELPSAEASAKIGIWSGRQKDSLKQTGLKRQRDRESVSKNSYIPLKNRDIIKLNKESEIAISKMEFSALADYTGKLSNRAVRRWYLHQDSLIPERIDRRNSLEEQAKQAFEMRNINRSHARDLMRDKELRKKLDINDPNKSFEELIENKMTRKGMSRREAVKDILKTATKTRKSVNRKFGLED